MVQRVTVTIPDELGERLNAVKDRFNVSRVCQEALASEVSRQELLTKENPTMADVIERLRAEKRQFYKGCEDKGFEEGYHDAHQMSFPHLKELGECLPTPEQFLFWIKATASVPLGSSVKPQVGQEPVVSDMELIGRAHEIYPELATRTVSRESDPLFNYLAYMNGWFHGVSKFWFEVKDQLGD